MGGRAKVRPLCRRCRQREPLTPQRRYCERCREERAMNREVRSAEGRLRWATRVCDGCRQPSWRLVDGFCQRCVDTGVAAKMARRIAASVEWQYRQVRRSGQFTVTPEVAFGQRAAWHEVAWAQARQGEE